MLQELGIIAKMRQTRPSMDHHAILLRTANMAWMTSESTAARGMDTCFIWKLWANSTSSRDSLTGHQVRHSGILGKFNLGTTELNFNSSCWRKLYIYIHFLFPAYSVDDWRVGANYEHGEWTWEGTDIEVDEAMWKSGEPSHLGRGHCVEMQREGRYNLNTFPCSHARRFICEFWLCLKITSMEDMDWFRRWLWNKICTCTCKPHTFASFIHSFIHSFTFSNQVRNQTDESINLLIFSVQYFYI